MDETQPGSSAFDRPTAGVSRLSPDEVAGRTFPAARKGIAEPEVRAFLRRVADELGAAREREHELLAEIDRIEALRRSSRPLSDEELLQALGEETAAVLKSARDAAEDMRRKAEERSAALLQDAQDQAARLRQETEDYRSTRTREADEQAKAAIAEAEERAGGLRADAERDAQRNRDEAAAAAAAEIEAAKAQGRQILEESRALRERVLADMARRRTLVEAQIDELKAGRDRLLDAYRTVKRTFLEATEALARVEAEAGPAPVIDDAEIERILQADVQQPAAPAAAHASVPHDDKTGSEPTEAEPAVTEVSDEGVPEEEVGAEGTDEETGDEEAPDVDDLFARLRAEREAAALLADAEELAAPATVDLTVEASEEPSAATAPVAATPAERAEPTSPAGTDATDATDAAREIAEPEHEAADATEPAPQQLHAALTALVGAAVPKAARKAKRVAQDEQNAILDAVRRHRGRPSSDAVLPAADAQAEQWADALDEVVAQAYAAGRASTGAEPGAADAGTRALAVELAGGLVSSLRARLVAAIDDGPDLGADTNPGIIERVSARYREWKTQWAEGELTDLVFAAHARGVLDGVGTGTVLHWVTPPDGCSPDCADNALEPTAAGSPFPTGATAPPAHPGCRCLLATSEALSVT